ncbi:conjugative transfer relaxase/helicase TraI domain-containing protein [Cronobacter sakazakii]|uniref:conjugative transfer relaxase/helicase TraI domain-containing protein n=1 Tax=Cronobacter sakazakii TaxID=28141 RepID=UPI001EFC647D|nr:conjugative transfer relaxase/helicase TraI domain-containing protein [Cronobacter sakazakii]
MTESNGKWKALATDYIHGAGFIETVMKMQVTLGKIYRQALREQVEALGHKVESVGKNGLWEIKGVPEVVREEFSSRGKEIEGAVGAEATLRSRDVAAKDTRQAKVDPSRLRLRERWLGQMKDLGWDMQEYQDSLRSPEKDGAAEPELTQAEGLVAPEKKDAVPQTSLPEKGNAGKEKPELATVRDVPAVSERTDREQSVQPEKADPGPEISMPEKVVPAEEKPQPATVRDVPAVSERTDRDQPAQAEKAEPGPAISAPERTITAEHPEPLHGKPAGKEPEPRPEVTDAVRMAVSQLSDSKTRFTWGELMLTATEFSEKLPDVKELRLAIDASLKDGLIVPLDSEKGVFTSRIHLLDELSLQAVTGYGAQGASSDYVISLEGTQEGRKALASQRAFYITASRAKDHVQIYTDGLADWTKAVKMPEREAKTAHDALKPETQRQQARAIWAMGQPLARTAIGRTWLRHQGMEAQAMTARIIPATKRYPEPALALPLYDNNGKSAGLALVPVVAGDNGRLTQGETRMVATQGARGAVLQRSHSGKTVVVNSLQEALNTVRARPQDGVVWQTGEDKPSVHLLKISRGQADDTAALASSALNAQEQEQERLAEQARAEAARQREVQLRDGQEKIRLPEEQPIILPADEKAAREAALPVIPDAGVLRRVAGETQPAGGDQNAVKQALMQEAGEALLQNSGKTVDMQQIAGRVASELAEQSRAELPRQESAPERGRQPEQEERGHTRHIQKER